MTTAMRPSPRCRRLLLDVSRYLDGDLPAARRRTVERHVDTCECCGTMAARLRKMVGFRNIAVHDYQRVNLEIVKAILVERLDDFLEFTRIVITR